MTNTVETKTADRPASMDILHAEIREDTRRGGWMRLYDAGRRHLLKRSEPAIDHEAVEDVVTKPGGGPP